MVDDSHKSHLDRYDSMVNRENKRIALIVLFTVSLLVLGALFVQVLI